MEELQEKMKVVLATSFSFYLKAHQFHWNVQGPNFAQYHDYLGELYEEVHASIDLTAEEIRKLGVFAPGSYMRFMELSHVNDSVNIPEAREMLSILYADNRVVLNVLREARMVAEMSQAIGTANYLDDRISAHDKHSWMLQSFLQ